MGEVERDRRRSPERERAQGRNFMARFHCRADRKFPLCGTWRIARSLLRRRSEAARSAPTQWRPLSKEGRAAWSGDECGCC